MGDETYKHRQWLNKRRKNMNWMMVTTKWRGFVSDGAQSRTFACENNTDNQVRSRIYFQSFRENIEWKFIWFAPSGLGAGGVCIFLSISWKWHSSAVHFFSCSASQSQCSDGFNKINWNVVLLQLMCSLQCLHAYVCSFPRYFLVIYCFCSFCIKNQTSSHFLHVMQTLHCNTISPSSFWPASVP